MEFIGITTDGELVFMDKFNNFMGGGCGFTMGTITEEDIKNGNDINMLMDDYRYLWVSAVTDNATDLGLEDWIQLLIEECKGSDKLFVSDDPSFRYDAERILEELPEEIKQRVEDEIGVLGEDYAHLNCMCCGSILNTENRYGVEDTYKFIADREFFLKVVNNPASEK